MRDAVDFWLSLPSPDPVSLDRMGVSFRASQMVGGVRQMGADWVLPCYVDPPSIWRSVDDPALVDLVAFDPAQPSRWRCKYSDGVMLGEAAYEEARLYRLPLPVLRTPMTWLQSGGAGVFPLDALRFGIAVVGYPALELVGEDLEHGRALRQLVERIPRLSIPRIRVAA